MNLPAPRWLLPACLALTLGACHDSDDSPASNTSSSGGASSGGGSSTTNGTASATTGSVTSGGGSQGSATTGGTASGGATSAGGSATTTTASGGLGGGAATGGIGGAAGAGPEPCGFEITGTMSEEIPTVGIVEWATDLPGVTAARIEFSLDDPEEGEVNVGSGGPIAADDSRALLLGLKPNRSYTYRIQVSAGETVCTSPDHELVTGADPDAESVTRVTATTAIARTPGFIVACSYSRSSALILDTDGDVVWRSDSPAQCSRAHMDWNGEYMWMLKANPTYDDEGDVRRVRMDGTGVEQIPALERSHHDFAVLPGGATAFLVWTDQDDLSSDLIERSSEGTLRTLTRLDDATFLATLSTDYHANALRYYANGDSYTLSDLALGGISKLNREGQIQWQLRGDCEGASPAQCAEAPLFGNHGHQLLENGNLLVFLANNGSGRPFDEPSPVYEYSFSEAASALTAAVEWSYTGGSASLILGDVQRLPNGSTLVTYSTGTDSKGVIEEVSPEGSLVQSLTGQGLFGYASFRETLYGPPQ